MKQTCGECEHVKSCMNCPAYWAHCSKVKDRHTTDMVRFDNICQFIPSKFKSREGK